MYRCLGLHGCAGSSWLQRRGLLSRCGAWASHCSGFSSCGAQAWGRVGSPVVAHGLHYSEVRGIFPDQTLSPCSLRWQPDSYPLYHQGSLRRPNFKLKPSSISEVDHCYLLGSFIQFCFSLIYYFRCLFPISYE